MLKNLALSQLVPFARNAYYSLTATVNQTWSILIPVCIFLLLVIVVMVLRGGRLARIVVPWTLAVLVGSTGYFFFVESLGSLFWPAPYVGYVFWAQAGLLFLAPLFFAANRQRGWPELAYFFGVLVFLPLYFWVCQREFSQWEVPGLGPDATVLIAISGLISIGYRRWWLFAVLFLWCLISATISWTLGVWQGILLPAVALGGLIMAYIRSG